MADEKKEEAVNSESSEDQNENLRKVGSIAVPAVVGHSWLI